jgi:hypothetical protein
VQDRDRNAANPASGSRDQHLSIAGAKVMPLQGHDGEHRGKPRSADAHSLLGCHPFGQPH